MSLNKECKIRYEGTKPSSILTEALLPPSEREKVERKEKIFFLFLNLFPLHVVESLYWKSIWWGGLDDDDNNKNNNDKTYNEKGPELFVIASSNILSKFDAEITENYW